MAGPRRTDVPKQTTDAPQAERRPTEGSREGAVARGKGPETAARRRGRPAGSKNKPKSLIPAEIAHQLLDLMKERLPGEHYEYMKGVIVKGEAISTEREVDMLITLVRGSLMPYLAMEALPVPILDDEGEPVLDEESGEPRMHFPGINRDVTDRLKLLNSLIGLKDTIEKRKADPDDDKEHVLLKVVASKQLDAGRLALLAGFQPGGLAGDADGTRRLDAGPRTVSGEVAERQES